MSQGDKVLFMTTFILTIMNTITCYLQRFRDEGATSGPYVCRSVRVGTCVCAYLYNIKCSCLRCLFLL